MSRRELPPFPPAPAGFDPTAPADSLPGSGRKQMLMHWRATLGRPIFVAGDATGKERSQCGPLDPADEPTQDHRRLSTATKERQGVRPRHGRWEARLWDNGKQRTLGTFDTQGEAIAALKEAEVDLAA